MMEGLKETLIGLAILATLWLIAMLYNIFSQIAREDTKHGKMARIIGKVSSGAILTYIVICSLGGLKAGLILLFT